MNYNFYAILGISIGIILMEVVLYFMLTEFGVTTFNTAIIMGAGGIFVFIYGLRTMGFSFKKAKFDVGESKDE